MSLDPFSRFCRQICGSSERRADFCLMPARNGEVPGATR
jgi:hypothetical protein